MGMKTRRRMMLGLVVSMIEDAGLSLVFDKRRIRPRRSLGKDAEYTPITPAAVRRCHPPRGDFDIPRDSYMWA